MWFLLQKQTKMKRSREEVVEAVENTIRELQLTSREVSEAFIERGLSTLTMGELLQLYDHSLPSKWWKENRVWERILRYEAGNNTVTRLERLLSRNPEPKINYKWVLLAWRLYKRHQRLVEKAKVEAGVSSWREWRTRLSFVQVHDDDSRNFGNIILDSALHPNTLFIDNYAGWNSQTGAKNRSIIPFVLGRMGISFENDIQWNPRVTGLTADCAIDLTLENLVMFIYFVFQMKDVYIKPQYAQGVDELVNDLESEHIRCSVCQLEEANFRHATTNALYCSKECFISSQIK